MITYIYWIAVIAVLLAVIFFIGIRMSAWKATGVISALFLLLAFGAYFFHFQQIFVKKWGGVMSLTVPAGQQHIQATWKDENLWLENYDPKTNTCHFSEYSRGNLLQGRVHIKNCNPLR